MENLNAEREQITSSNNELYDYVKRIVAAVKIKGEGDHEDVPSILRKFANGYEQKIKELTEERTDHITMLLAKDVIIQDLNDKHNLLTEENKQFRYEQRKLIEENERLHASCTELTRKCASLTEENERLRAENIVMLPCKAGDTVYFAYKYKDYGKVFDAKVVSVEYFEEDDIYLHVLHYNGYKEPIPSTKYLGKEVFLTREEAEEALKGE